MIVRKAKMGVIAPEEVDSGRYTAYLENTDGANITRTPVRVTHTSTYKTYSGGLIGFPTPEEDILICQTDDQIDKNMWYYLSTIISPQNSNTTADTEKKPTYTNPASAAKGRLGVPQKTSLIGPDGDSKIEIRRDYDDKKMDSGILLESGTGKQIKLEDSPDKNNIVLKTDKGILGGHAMIELTGITDIDSSRPSNQVRIYATGPISLLSRDSNIDLSIIDGGQINIENKSSGLMRAGALDPTFGNINIKSTNGDINIVAGPDPLSGDVVPPTVGPTAPLASVNINALGGPLTSLNIHTDGILNLSGGTAVRIAGGDLRFDVAGIAPVQIEGVVVNINPVA